MKQHTMIIVAMLALLVGGIGGFLAAKHVRDDDGDRFGLRRDENREADTQGNNAVPSNRSEGTMNMMSDGSMMGDNGMMGMHMMISNEREFLTEMIPHHQEAVDTTRQVLAHGATTPEVKKLVEGIIAAQEKEIADMKTWYQNWYGEAYQDKGTYKPMMRDLSKLSGSALDRAFLEDMIMHHMGAIMMAQSVQSHLEHEELKTLTAHIVSSQSSEITLMRSLLTTLQ